VGVGDLGRDPGRLPDDVAPGINQDQPTLSLELVAAGVVAPGVVRREVVDLAVDLDRQFERREGEVETVFAVRAGGELDVGDRKTAAPEETEGLALQHAGMATPR
jgi:hypothetical protein